MTQPTTDSLSIICLDDSPIVLSGMNSMLIKTGFKEANIKTTKTVKDALVLAEDNSFDIFICDYNLGDTLNGKQVFEELRNKRLIKANTIFIIISSESDAAIVKSIIELNPDEYILKPFNYLELKARLLATIKRKYILVPIFECEYSSDYKEGVKRCEELESFYPQYYFTIQKYKAKFLGKLSQFAEAEQVYRDTLKQKNLDWAKLGLANTLTKVGRCTEAFEIINKILTYHPNNAGAHIEMSNVYIKTNRVPKAISHLKIANKLIPGNSERELVIANLCNAVGDYQSALQHYRGYAAINRYTFRNNIFSKLNIIRQILFAAVHLKGKSRDFLINDAASHISELYNSYDTTNYEQQIKVIAAHLSLVKREYKSAAGILRDVHADNSFKHYYDLFHFSWLLNEMSFYTEFDKTIEDCFASLLNLFGDEYIVQSQIEMATSLRSTKQKRIHQLIHSYKIASELRKECDYQKLLLTYIGIQKKYPYLGNVAFKIVQLLGQVWPFGFGAKQVSQLLFKCDFIVTQLLNLSPVETNKYQISVDKVKESITKHLLEIKE